MGAVEAKWVPRRSDQGADVIADFQLMGGLLVTVGIQAKFYQPGKPMERTRWTSWPMPCGRGWPRWAW
jgi:hypothetical protein